MSVSPENLADTADDQVCEVLGDEATTIKRIIATWLRQLRRRFSELSNYDCNVSKLPAVQTSDYKAVRRAPTSARRLLFKHSAPY